MNNPKLTYLLLKYKGITDPNILKEIPGPVIDKAYSISVHLERAGRTSRVKEIFESKGPVSGYQYLGDLLKEQLIIYYNTTNEEDQILDLEVDNIIGQELTSQSFNKISDAVIKEIYYDIGKFCDSKEYNKHKSNTTLKRKFLSNKVETSIVLCNHIHRAVRDRVKQQLRFETVLRNLELTIIKDAATID